MNPLCSLFFFLVEHVRLTWDITLELYDMIDWNGYLSLVSELREVEGAGGGVWKIDMWGYLGDGDACIWKFHATFLVKKKGSNNKQNKLGNTPPPR